MSVYALTNAFAFIHGYDMSADLKDAKVDVEAEALDSTTFGTSGYKSFVAGLKTVNCELSGLAQYATSGVPDTEIFSDLGTANRVHVIGNVNTAGSPCLMFQAGKFKYDQFGQLGELAPFSLTSHGTDGVGVVRGYLLAAKQNISSTGAIGSVVQIGAVSATQYIYVAISTFSIGTSFTLQIQSDDNGGMSSPTTRVTSASITAAGGTWVTRVAGPVTDDYWRVNVSAASGTSSIAIAVGIA